MKITRRHAIALGLTAGARALVADGQAGERLAPPSWTCSHHPDVVEDTRGRCPICKMPLQPIRLDLAWTCPVHSGNWSSTTGKCPTCWRELVQVVVALSWTCPIHPNVDRLDSGRCPTCNRQLVLRRSNRPHGDHSPRHGGLFFMAPDNWYHLEATHPADGVFRFYVYDIYTKPAVPRSARGWVAAAPLAGVGLGEKDELAGFTPWRLRNGDYFETRLKGLTLSASIIVKVRFKTGSPLHRFDFNFPSHTKDNRPS